jgi:type II secretory pathway pseudopilin PulG
MRNGRRRRPRDSGFAYVLLLVAVALIGVAASSAISLGSTIARRDAEHQLLSIGAEYERALHSYAGAPTVGGAPNTGQRPRSLEDLLKDPRTPGIRRHLRQVYPDPLSGKAEWGLITDAQGLIVGIHSLAEGKPLRRTGFDPQWAHFEEAESYGQWVFGSNGAPIRGK